MCRTPSRCSVSWSGNCGRAPNVPRGRKVMTVRGLTELASEGIDAMMRAVWDWQAKVDALVITGTDDQDVIATHDTTGRLIELYVRPGLQQQLTTEEFED